MTKTDYIDILRDLKNKIYKPVYFLMGEEPYYIDIITDYIAANVLTDSEKEFNQLVMYGKDTTALNVINSAKRFPMMAQYQVVIVKEAQTLDKIDDLHFYVEKPLKSTILVINYKYKSLDKRKKLYKDLLQNGVVFESDRLYDDKIPGWISSYLKSKNLSIDLKACSLVTDYLGNDLSRIANELDKLIITLGPGTTTINSAHVEKNIGISKEYNNFELQKALSQKNIVKANRIINYFDKNQKLNPISFTFSSLYHFFSKILLYHSIEDKSTKNVASVMKVNPYFVDEYKLAAKNYDPAKVVSIISLLREYDLKSKGFGNATITPGSILKELVYKILH
jgi:DNA polymerase III subunit delta